MVNYGMVTQFQFAMELIKTFKVSEKQGRKCKKLLGQFP